MDKQDIIKKHLSGQLSPEDEKAFQQELESNDEIREEVSNQVIKDFNRTQIKESLKSISLEQKSNTKNNLKLLYLAASIALLVGIPLYFMNNQKSNDVLFSDYFDPYQNVVSYRGETDEDLINKAMGYYEKGRYKEASDIFNKIETKTDEVYLYHGISLIANKKYTESIVPLEKLINSKSQYTPQAEWYLSLAYLKINDSKSATIHLENVIEQNSFKVKESKELLKQLK